MPESDEYNRFPDIHDGAPQTEITGIAQPEEVAGDRLVEFYYLGNPVRSDLRIFQQFERFDYCYRKGRQKFNLL
jgi:hypothetical protein